MCGILGIFSSLPVAFELYEGLIHLQHRGQDAAGILTATNKLYFKSGLGLVRDNFSTKTVAELKGNLGIAHTRYPTSGGYSAKDIQPLYCEENGLGLAHNGNLLNHEQLLEELTYQANTKLDSEIFLILLKNLLQNSSNLQEEDFFERLCKVVSYILESVQGAYSIIAILANHGLIAFRDLNGIRPLVWGSRENPDGSSDTIFSSETTPFYPLGFSPQGDILPGELAFVGKSGKRYRRVLRTQELRPCVFEYVYFARPDATLNGVSVYRSRLRMGQNLALLWKKNFPELIPDIVIPVPFTANTAALSFAHTLGVRYSEGLYKNPFIGRTFIMPDQPMRKLSIRQKLTPQPTEINNKTVLIVDDSIVRGTTSREIVKMVREAGANEIYFVSTAPPLINPCFYGIDIPSSEELIASSLDVEAIAKFIGVDKLLYQTQTDLIEAVTRRGDHKMSKPCMACMDGDYFCENLTQKKMLSLNQQRAQAKTEVACQ